MQTKKKKKQINPNNKEIIHTTLRVSHTKTKNFALKLLFNSIAVNTIDLSFLV